MIAVKSLNEKDKADYSDFLKTERKSILDLSISPLVPPHEDMVIIQTSASENRSLFLHKIQKMFDEKYVIRCSANGCITISRHEPYVLPDGNTLMFSGYVYYHNKMLIGQDETVHSLTSVTALEEKYGEYCACTMSNEGVELFSDYFGMVPWFYYHKEGLFVASNHYHLMLHVLKYCLSVGLNMDVRRSRVNLITSGFMYGSPFTKDLDVMGCHMTLAYEKIIVDEKANYVLKRTSLWDIVNSHEPWDENVYEQYIRAAADEIYDNVKACFEHKRFNKVVVDLSGGFDSRAVFATVTRLPKELQKKALTYTRRSGTPDDVEVASNVLGVYNYPRYSNVLTDTSDVKKGSFVNLAQVSRNLGLFSVNTFLYSSEYSKEDILELTGGNGDAVLGFARIRGELEYCLGDKRLLARLGGCYLYNSVEELQEVFKDQENIILDTLSNYASDYGLFQKFHLLYIDFRNRFNFGSSHSVENSSMRVPGLFSKNALKAKWMWFGCFPKNQIPDERVSVDLISRINPLLACFPFAKNNDKVLPSKEHLLYPAQVEIKKSSEPIQIANSTDSPNLYKHKVREFMDDIEVAEQMLLALRDYSNAYEPVCMGLFKVLSIMKESPDEARTGHGREQIRKIYDAYYQMKYCEANYYAPDLVEYKANDKAMVYQHYNWPKTAFYKCSGGIKCLRDNGMLYTFKRTLFHLHIIKEWKENG